VFSTTGLPLHKGTCMTGARARGRAHLERLSSGDRVRCRRWLDIRAAFFVSGQSPPFRAPVPCVVPAFRSSERSPLDACHRSRPASERPLPPAVGRSHVETPFHDGKRPHARRRCPLTPPKAVDVCYTHGRPGRRVAASRPRGLRVRALREPAFSRRRNGSFESARPAAALRD
jgi:hypothetical protein